VCTWTACAGEKYYLRNKFFSARNLAKFYNPVVRLNVEGCVACFDAAKKAIIVGRQIKLSELLCLLRWCFFCEDFA
jgi:hypothetical protein